MTSYVFWFWFLTKFIFRTDLRKYYIFYGYFHGIFFLFDTNQDWRMTAENGCSITCPWVTIFLPVTNNSLCTGTLTFLLCTHENSTETIDSLVRHNYFSFYYTRKTYTHVVLALLLILSREKIYSVYLLKGKRKWIIKSVIILHIHPVHEF